ncbi:hypothetical protein H5410_056010 [Solanum commersonii]|uniref:Uncharacterized protein n=1 Tax=Solanum commersonii TaxID=4109 RepID=A0A9J5WL13_SOLCO|nr:hypothetical protein H5410_056010 [Solanum commersonii]
MITFPNTAKHARYRDTMKRNAFSFTSSYTLKRVRQRRSCDERQENTQRGELQITKTIRERDGEYREKGLRKYGIKNQSSGREGDQY